MTFICDVSIVLAGEYVHGLLVYLKLIKKNHCLPLILRYWVITRSHDMCYSLLLSQQEKDSGCALLILLPFHHILMIGDVESGNKGNTSQEGK